LVISGLKVTGFLENLSSKRMKCLALLRQAEGSTLREMPLRRKELPWTTSSSRHANIVHLELNPRKLICSEYPNPQEVQLVSSLVVRLVALVLVTMSSQIKPRDESDIATTKIRGRGFNRQYGKSTHLQCTSNRPLGMFIHSVTRVTSSCQNRVTNTFTFPAFRRVTSLDPWNPG